MKVAVLTTDTPHHAYFVRAMTRVCDEVVAFVETSPPSRRTFEVHHAFEEERDRYEWQTWFGGKPTGICELTPTHAVPTMNSDGAVESLRRAASDMVVVFGTGVLRQRVIDVCAGRIFNLHGGDPEVYRGLDTHLWAVFHGDFSGLVTTLHRLDAGIDTGDIVSQGRIPLTRGMTLAQLRAANTEVCVALASAAVGMMVSSRDVASRPQRKKGRYYSAMPASLKEICNTRFAAHTSALPT